MSLVANKRRSGWKKLKDNLNTFMRNQEKAARVVKLFVVILARFVHPEDDGDGNGSIRHVPNRSDSEDVGLVLKLQQRLKTVEKDKASLATRVEELERESPTADVRRAQDMIRLQELEMENAKIKDDLKNLRRQAATENEVQLPRSLDMLMSQFDAMSDELDRRREECEPWWLTRLLEVTLEKNDLLSEQLKKYRSQMKLAKKVKQEGVPAENQEASPEVHETVHSTRWIERSESPLPVVRKKETNYLGMFDFNVDDEEQIARNLVYATRKSVNAIRRLIKKRHEDLDTLVVWLVNTCRLVDSLKQYSGEKTFQEENDTLKQNEQCLRNFDLSNYRQAVIKCMEERVQKLIVTAVLEHDHISHLLRKLTIFHQVLQLYGVDPTLIAQAFRQDIHGQDTMSACIVDTLQPIIQAAWLLHLLQARESDDDIRHICTMCSRLTSAQIIKILNLYTPADELEDRIPIF
ncbi:hypothetical protein DAPPUDRAFT_100969 [Daphnia pulex]|uniref:Dilute domain-containing protein n=1 Tax=Daphnia pulex TaxID=6669 RepID=E9GBU1_DAPPU|nr:hypothetical protein DAPPUDRAFT_100969 [Daphnia pulex]|eukprot:EFX83099.1 hypothetical protein DAPPUDRAFT_100969 [Daphnia pulex]